MSGDPPPDEFDFDVDIYTFLPHLLAHEITEGAPAPAPRPPSDAEAASPGAEGDAVDDEMSDYETAVDERKGNKHDARAAE